MCVQGSSEGAYPTLTLLPFRFRFQSPYASSPWLAFCLHCKLFRCSLGSTVVTIHPFYICVRVRCGPYEEAWPVVRPSVRLRNIAEFSSSVVPARRIGLRVPDVSQGCSSSLRRPPAPYHSAYLCLSQHRIQ